MFSVLRVSCYTMYDCTLFLNVLHIYQSWDISFFPPYPELVDITFLWAMHGSYTQIRVLRITDTQVKMFVCLHMYIWFQFAVITEIALDVLDRIFFDFHFEIFGTIDYGTWPLKYSMGQCSGFASMKSIIKSLHTLASLCIIIMLAML